MNLSHRCSHAICFFFSYSIEWLASANHALFAPFYVVLLKTFNSITDRRTSIYLILCIIVTSLQISYQITCDLIAVVYLREIAFLGWSHSETCCDTCECPWKRPLTYARISHSNLIVNWKISKFVIEKWRDKITQIKKNTLLHQSLNERQTIVTVKKNELFCPDSIG